MPRVRITNDVQVDGRMLRGGSTVDLDEASAGRVVAAGAGRVEGVEVRTTDSTATPRRAVKRGG